MTKILIIGLGTAGFAAALAIKKQDRNAEITFIDKKDFDLLHVCGLPYVLQRKLHSFSKLKHDINAKLMNINIINKSQATKVDTENKLVFYKNLETNEQAKENYDKLIIAVGSHTFIPPIDGIENNEYIFKVSNIENTEKLDNAIENSESAVIIGASAIGLETAYALKNRGLDITVIDILPQTFPKALDEDISKILEEYLQNKGINLKLGKKLEKIDKKDVYVEGEKITADIIVMATGVRPNVKLAGDSGIKTNKFGIEVNEKLETNAKDVYAAGDSVTLNSIITKKSFPAWLANTAYKQGTAAGINAAGGEAKIKGVISTFVSVVGEIEIAATGLNTFLAKQNNYEIVTGKSKSSDIPEWMPGAEPLIVKVIADKKTGKILGGQSIGKGAASKVNIISTAIKSGMTLKDLSETELAYCPAVSQTYDVLASAVDLALRRLKK